MKISIYMASSVNGLISNKRGVPDWLSPEFEKGFMEICRRSKAVIMGKTTYNVLAPEYLPLKEEEGTMAVFTRDITSKPAQSNVVFTDKDPKGIVAMLEAKGHTEAVIIGGTRTASDFIKAGLVDELILVVEPVLFGGGLPLFKDVDFEYTIDLIEVKNLNANTIQVHYRLKK
jgi:dihydrofolate reductase